jgi:excisionase family DNA binding protein
MKNSYDFPSDATNPDQTAEARHKSPSDTPRLAYTIDEVSKLLTLGRTSLYSRLKSGELRARKCGKRTLILHEDLQQFLSDLDSVQPSSGFAKE